MSNETFSDPARLAQQLVAAANSLSDEEAGQRYRQILSQLPAQEAAQLNTLALTQVAPDQRRVLASGFKQAHQDPGRPFDGYDEDDDDVAASPQSLGRMSAKAAHQDPALVNNLLGGENSSIGGQIGKAALAALAALLIRRLMSGQGQQAQGGAGSFGGPGPSSGIDPVAAILGSLLGGATGAQQQTGGAGDLSSVLGGLLGGAQQAPAGRGRQAPAGDLSSVLGGLLGGGAAGNQAGGAGDLSSVLGGLLGGGAAGNQAGGAGDLGSILGGAMGGGGGSYGGQAQGSGPDLSSILGSILGGGSQRSHRKD